MLKALLGWKGYVAAAGAGAIVAGLAVGIGQGWRHDAAISTMVATHAQVMQGYADAAYLAQEQAREEEHRRIAAMENIRNETDQELARVRADERAAAERRVQHAAEEFAARNRCTAGSTGIAGAGQAGTDPLDLLAELFGRADDRAGELAAIADRARVAGLACEQAYGSLRDRPSP